MGLVWAVVLTQGPDFGVSNPDFPVPLSRRALESIQGRRLGVPETVGIDRTS